jgi:hypothetical protein
VGVLPATIEMLARIMSDEPRPSGALPLVTRRDPYIHFDRDAAGRLSGIRQRREGDAMPDVGEGDMGLFALTRRTYDVLLPEYAESVTRGSGTGERNFVPFVPWLAQRERVATFACTDERESIGVNTPEELRLMDEWIASRTA